MTRSALVTLIALTHCRSVPERGQEQLPAAPKTEASQVNAPPPDATGVRDPVGAVEMLHALCEHAKAEDDAWVAERVRLPLQGIGAINDEPDPMVSPHDDDEVKNMKYARFCRLLPEGETSLREFTVEAHHAVGILDLGKTPHRIRFDLTGEAPRLVEVDALIEPTPQPKRPAKARPYTLEALPIGFREGESSEAISLRREVIAALKSDPNCIEAYLDTDPTVARFSVSVEAGDEGRASPRVDPFQLVRMSLIACLRGELSDLDVTGYPVGTTTKVEILAPVSADELPADTPTVVMPRQ